MVTFKYRAVILKQIRLVRVMHIPTNHYNCYYNAYEPALLVDFPPFYQGGYFFVTFVCLPEHQVFAEKGSTPTIYGF